MPALLQAVFAYIVTTNGLLLISAANAIAWAVKLMGMAHGWHGVIETAVASAVLITLGTLVTQFFHG